jgi:hypothetical protein
VSQECPRSVPGVSLGVSLFAFSQKGVTDCIPYSTVNPRSWFVQFDQGYMLYQSNQCVNDFANPAVFSDGSLSTMRTVEFFRCIAASGCGSQTWVHRQGARGSEEPTARHEMWKMFHNRLRWIGARRATSITVQALPGGRSAGPDRLYSRQRHTSSERREVFP